MYLPLIILLVTMLGTVTKKIIGKPFEESLIVGLLLVICFLQVAYMGDVLLYSVRFLQIILPLAFFLFVILAIKKKEVLQEGRDIFSVPFLSYIIYLVLVYYITKDNKVMLGDELVYWASLPKVLFYFEGKLQLKELFQVFCVDYIPGMPLYSYFLQQLNGSFNEGLLYFGYAALSGALILPVFKYRKKWYHIILNVLMLYYLPLVFFNTRSNDYAVFYKTLYIDPIMGVSVAAMVWMLMYKPWEDKSTWIRYVLLSVFVTILKSSGIAFVMTSGVILTIHLFKTERHYLCKCSYWMGLALPITYWGSWQLLIRHYQLNNTVSYSPVSIFDVSFLKSFVNFLEKKTILEPFFGGVEGICTSLGLILLLSVLFYVLYLQVKQVRCEDTLQGFEFLVFNTYVQMLVFVIGLYGLCVGSWKGKLLSCERYISTIFEMMACVLAFVLIYEGRKLYKDRKTIIHVIGVLSGIMAIILFMPLRSPDLSRGNIYPMYIYEDYDSIVGFLRDADIGDSKVDTIMLLVDENPVYSDEQQWIKGWYGHLRNMLAFSVIENSLQCDMKTRFTSEMEKNESIGEDKLRISLKDGTLEGTDYVLWLHGHYTEMPINSWELYHIDSSNNKEAILTRSLEGRKNI